ncbi:hypothetical protein D3C81_1680060 [compost metagenome]
MSSTTQTIHVTRKINPIWLNESLIARPTALLTAKSNSDTPQIRPRISMNTMAMAMRNNAWERLRKRSL